MSVVSEYGKPVKSVPNVNNVCCELTAVKNYIVTRHCSLSATARHAPLCLYTNDLCVSGAVTSPLQRVSAPPPAIRVRSVRAGLLSAWRQRHFRIHFHDTCTDKTQKCISRAPLCALCILRDNIVWNGQALIVM